MGRLRRYVESVRKRLTDIRLAEADCSIIFQISDAVRFRLKYILVS